MKTNKNLIDKINLNKFLKILFNIVIFSFVFQINVDAQVVIHKNEDKLESVVQAANNEFVILVDNSNWDNIKTYPNEEKVTFEKEEYAVHVKAVTLKNNDKIKDIDDYDEVTKIANAYGITTISGMSFPVDGMHQQKSHKWNVIITYTSKEEYAKIQYITTCNGILYTIYAKSNTLGTDSSTMLSETIGLLYDIYIGKDVDILEGLLIDLYDKENMSEVEYDYDYLDDMDSYYNEDINDNSNFYNESFADKSTKEFVEAVWQRIKSNSRSISAEGGDATGMVIIIIINFVMIAITKLVLKINESFYNRFRLTIGYSLIIMVTLWYVKGASLLVTGVLFIMYVGMTWTKSFKMPCCADEDKNSLVDDGPDVFANKRRWF